MATSVVRAGSEDGDPAPLHVGRRQRNRRERERAYLDAAMGVAGRHGIGSLTMARLADEVDAAVGTVYTYFPSKGALVAELQREAIERLTDAYHRIRDSSEERLRTWNDPAAVAVARLMVFGTFWIDSADTHPQEASFLHALISESEEMVPPEEHYRVLPAAMALLDEARAEVVAAGDLGVIRVNDAMNLVIRWAAALTGALLTSNLAPLNPVAFNGRSLARNLQRDLLLGWGAPVEFVDRSEEHLEDLVDLGLLAPLTPSVGGA